MRSLASLGEMDDAMDGAIKVADVAEETYQVQNDHAPFELLKLPVEIQQHIFAKVESKGLMQLAATCKTLNTAINDTGQDERYALARPHFSWTNRMPAVLLLDFSLQTRYLISGESFVFNQVIWLKHTQRCSILL